MAVPSTVQSLEGGGADNTPNSVPVCEPQGVTGGPSGRPGHDFRTRGCPGPCARRALLPGGSPLSPTETEVAHPQVRGHFPEPVRHRGEATRPSWCYRETARPCLGHQAAPRSRSAPGLPGPPFAPAPAEPTECCARKPRGIAPAGDPSASPGMPGT